jgi:alkylation response protein AidB-like acyl-CoA dehydrogenase
MMNFDYPENQETFRSKLKELFDPAEKATLTTAAGLDPQGMRAAFVRVMKKLGEAGYLSAGLESGKNSPDLLAVQEVLAATAPSLFLTAEASIRVFGRLLSVYGTADQKNEILPALRDGRLVGAVGLTETGMNLAGNPVLTKGTKEGDGFRVSGTKGHVVNAPVADCIAVAGECDTGPAFFLIANPSEGLFIGERMHTLGYDGAVISPITLRDCFVPSPSVLGPFPGQQVFKAARMWEDEILTAASLGLMQNAFDAASQYAKVHQSGGKPVIAYQEVAFKLAEMLTLLQTARLLAYRAAWMSETENREAAVLARCAKVFCTEAAEKVTSSALQVLGQQGFVRGNPAEEGYRDSKYLQIAGTSSEISRITIGDLLLEGR